MAKKPIAILGATGPVGQKAIALLANHPDFYVAEVAASDARVGKKYGEVVAWKDESILSADVAALELRPMLEIKSTYVISALPTDAALQVEPLLAARGHIVSSNAAAFRMQSDVPLLVPEINSAHLELLKLQKTSGKIVTNPNCSTVFLVSALAPLLQLGAIEHVSVVTMQAISGAGYPGVSALDILGNLIPHIGGEEDKIKEETKRILGASVQAANFGVTVHVHRVPVLHGHTVALHVRFVKEINISQAREAYLAWQQKNPDFIFLHDSHDRPQPARDITSQEMRTHVGRLKQGDDPRTIGLIALGHNLVRGAAGAALANLVSTIQYLETNR
jgi:aspartate-semialdehyde dehydrogenase